MSDHVRAREPDEPEHDGPGEADPVQVRAREGGTATENKELRQIDVTEGTASDETPQLKRQLTDVQRAFLAAYPLTATIQGAADAADINRCMHYEWLRTSPDYKAAFSEAVDEAAEKLEDAARHRAVEGLKRYRFTKNGDPIRHPVTGEPYYEHAYSDVLLIFLLKGLRPDKYRENLRVENAGAEQVRVVFDPNWYGNNAHDHAAAAASAPATDSPQ